MAYSLTLKRFVSSNLLLSSIRVIRSVVLAPSTSRLFNTNGGDRSSDVVDISPLRQEELYDFRGDFYNFHSEGFRRRCDANEIEDTLSLRVEMPGLGKEDVKVSVEQNNLIIEGKSKESEDDFRFGAYRSSMHLPDEIFKTDQIKAKMKDGVLKVVVPKIKEEEKGDEIQVQIDRFVY